MSKLRNPVTPDDHIRGPANAPLVLVEYGDYQCPYCGMAHPKLKRLEASLGDGLAYVFRHFPLSQIHPYALLGSMGAEAAGLQGKFWEMHDMIFENQELLGPEGIEEFAEALELDLDAFRNALGSAELESRVRRDFMGGVRSGVNGTPSFFLNGAKFEGPLEPELFRELMQAA